MHFTDLPPAPKGPSWLIPSVKAATIRDPNHPVPPVRTIFEYSENNIVPLKVYH